MDDGIRLLYFYRGRKEDYPPPFVLLLEARGWKIDPVAVSDDAAAFGILKVWRWGRKFSSYDVIAANEYFLTWAVCVRLINVRRKPKVAAMSFNQSRRLLLTGVTAIDRILNRIWRPVSMYLVHSKAEARLFGEIHDIAADKFIFSHWGHDLPQLQPEEIGPPRTPYVSMIGRNNRDLATFCAAVENTGITGVIITARYIVDRYLGEIPESVLVLTDRALEECIVYMQGSFAHLVLVMDGERGAGHITAVIAMLLGKPQIFSDVRPLEDYLIDQVNGIAVRIGDVEGVSNAIQALFNDSDLAAKLGANGQSFARRELSLGAASARAADALCALAKQN